MQKYIFTLSIIFLLIIQSDIFTKLHAQTPTGLTMTVQPAFEGNFKNGEWLPIFVTLTNNSTDFQGEIVVSVQAQEGELTFVRPVDLPSGSRKQYTIYILPNNFSRSIDVHLKQDDTSLIVQSVPIIRQQNDRYLIGVIAINPDNLNILSLIELPGRRESPEIISFTLEQIPDKIEGLRMLDALIINDIDTSALTSQQRTTLKDWVIGGGRLIIGGGVGVNRTLSGIPHELIFVEVHGQQDNQSLTLTLEDYTGETINTSGPFLMTHVQPQDSATVLLATSYDMPLIVEHEYGKGNVDFISLDLSQPPLKGWTGFVEMMQKIIEPSSAWSEHLPPDVSPRQTNDKYMSKALTNLPALDLPSIKILTILLLGYILLVGPINYIVLRWRNKTAWAWLTIPILTIAFTVLAYSVGLNLRGSDIIVNQISTLEIDSMGHVITNHSYIGIFSPNRQEYKVEVSGQPLLRPLIEYYEPWRSNTVSTGQAIQGMEVVQGEHAQIRSLMVNQWSMQSFAAENVPVESSLLEVTFIPKRHEINGTLVNHSGKTIKDIIVIFNQDFRKLGDLVAGERINMTFDLDKQIEFNNGGLSAYTLFQDMGNNREVEFKRNVLNSIIFQQGMLGIGLPDKNPLVIGWMDDSLVDIQLDNSTISSKETSLIYGYIPFTFEDDKIIIPPGFSTIESIDIDGESGVCRQGYGLEGYYINRGSIEAKMWLPNEAQNVSPSSLDIYVANEGWATTGTIVIKLRDRESGMWISIEDVKLGRNEIPQFERFYDVQNASLEILISQGELDQSMEGCLYFYLVMEGVKKLP